MSAICVLDCDCDFVDVDRAFPGLAVQHCHTELQACVAWLDGSARWFRSFEVEMLPLARYFAVHCPGGHVIGVRP